MEKHILNTPSGSSQITTDNSRKVYLHTLYTNLLLRHSLLLFFNIASVNFHILINLRTALAPMGIHLKVLRRRVFINSLRVARYVETSRTRPGEMWDPTGLAMRSKILDRKRSTEELEMIALLKGKQPCAVYFDDFNWRPESIDPAKIATVVRMLERTGKTPIIGGRFQRGVITAEGVKRLRSVGGHQEVGGELLGVLGGAAQSLAGTLSAPAGGLSFTLQGRQKALEEEQQQGAS
jgi:ribosomal protein L10